MKNSILTVVMPVYNREAYLKESIESVLNQTFSKFELIIVDDGSTDRSLEIISSFKDERIKVVHHEINKGVASARNTGYLNAQGKYIVISDSDDINHPQKFEKQLNYLESHPEIDVVGCFYQHFNENGNLQILKYARNDSTIKISSLFWLNQAPTSMFRKDKIMDKGILLHDETFEAAVDLEWCGKQPLNINFFNIQEVLYYYRRHSDQLTIESSYSKQKKFISISRIRTIKEKLKIDVSEYEIKIHDKLCDPFLDFELNQKDIIKWVIKLIDRNNELKVYNRILFSKIILNYYKKLCEWLEFDPSKMLKYEEELDAFEINKITRFVDDNSIIYKSLENKSIAIFGTLFMGRKLHHKILELRLNFQYFIDNYKSLQISHIEDYQVFNENILSSSPVDIVLISIESDSRFEVKKKLEEKFPEITFYLLDNFILEN